MLVLFDRANNRGSIVELVDLDVVLVVVGNEELQETISVEIVGSDGTDGASEVLDSFSLESTFAIGSHKVSGVITVTSNQDVCLFTIAWDDWVGEAWAHIGNEVRFSIHKARGDLPLVELAMEEALRNIIEEDACLGVVGFVVVDEELHLAITIDIEVMHAVSLIDGVVDNPREADLAVNHLIDGDTLAEELSCEDDVTLIAFDLLDGENYIGALCEDVFLPKISAMDTILRLSEPDKLTLAGLRVGSGGNIVLTTITVDVYPLTRVVKETSFVGRDLDQSLLLGDVLRGGCQDVDVTLGLTGW